MKQAFSSSKPGKGIAAKDGIALQTNSHNTTTKMTDTLCAILSIIGAILIYLIL